MLVVVYKTKGGGTAAVNCDSVIDTADGSITLKGICRAHQVAEFPSNDRVKLRWSDSTNRHDDFFPKSCIVGIYEKSETWEG